jgi:hypothetical protein
VIDLHLHTTASDGVLPPADLVARALAAGITTLSVTDHDTTRGLDAARAAAEALGVTFVTGIEITAVASGRDVHVLGYFFDPSSTVLVEFLARQQVDRVRRVREMAGRLAALGAPIDPDPVIAEALEGGRSVGRPHVAAALLAAGHVRSQAEAFTRFLEHGGPAFVSRRGAAPEDVIAMIMNAGGVASLAHPGLAGIDPLIPGLAAAGLQALEARHSDHDAPTEARYRALAAELDLAVSGGSDFHDDTGSRQGALGSVALPAADFAALAARRR